MNIIQGEDMFIVSKLGNTVTSSYPMKFTFVEDDSWIHGGSQHLSWHVCHNGITEFGFMFPCFFTFPCFFCVAFRKIDHLVNVITKFKTATHDLYWFIFHLFLTDETSAFGYPVNGLVFANVGECKDESVTTFQYMKTHFNSFLHLM